MGVLWKTLRQGDRSREKPAGWSYPPGRPPEHGSEILSIRAVADIEKTGKELLPFLHVDNDTPDRFYLEALKGANCRRMAIVGCQNLKIVPAERIEPLIKAIREPIRKHPRSRRLGRILYRI